MLLTININIFAINGRVTDKNGIPIPSASITFAISTNSSKTYQTISDTNGYYTLDLPTYDLTSDKQYQFFNVYPNPFHDGIILPFYLSKTAHCNLYIINTMGQRVRTIMDRVCSSGF